jgi:hypothetical protein
MASIGPIVLDTRWLRRLSLVASKALMPNEVIELKALAEELGVTLKWHTIKLDAWAEPTTEPA